ncbi:glucosidase [Methylobacterium komagatae]|uniref:Glucosidase n=1 Tax=Methylobacterium komagatae TaxID=374425 RepID=A0ABW2BHX0_9HYPH
MPEGPNASHLFETEEGRRLRACAADGWHRWGPYLAERQWGTVREDYSRDGTAWDYLPHDHARSRAYRWGEDGIAGFSDDKRLWCLALALWNGRDPILKERMFGLTNEEGNHGEDMKELYWLLDGTPTHSYMRMLYRYPHAAFPYAELVAENRRRKGRDMPEYELADTGVLAENRCFDVTVEYAKAAPDDVLMRVSVVNRGPEAAEIHVLPHLWSRNTWSWREDPKRPLLRLVEGPSVEATRAAGPCRLFRALQPAEFLFCENETNTARLFGVSGSYHPKDAINDDVVAGTRTRVNPLHEGTKCAALSRHTLMAGETIVLRYRLSPADAPGLDDAGFEAVFARRVAEADAFYAALQRDMTDPDARLVQRQALAGMLWSKQFYHFDVRRWLMGDPTQPEPPAERRHGRDSEWAHLNNADIVSMPDTWEYPWYAAWDLAFHCVTFALIDPEFAKGQLVLLTREWYMHPNGQLPAYEWAFGDVNPPVHAWAALRVYQMDAALTGRPDRTFLERVFHKLMLNFTWWVNRKDADGRNVFQGGFLGLDNIGIFDRSAPLPTGGTIDQADGTAWMAMYTLNLMRIALELAAEDPVYEDIATKFFEHFLYIAEAMTDIGGSGVGLWDEADEFFYDVLNLPDGKMLPLRVRSLVGLIPLCAVEVLDISLRDRFPGFARRAEWMLRNRPDLAALVSHWSQGEGEDRRPARAATGCCSRCCAGTA